MWDLTSKDLLKKKNKQTLKDLFKYRLFVGADLTVLYCMVVLYFILVLFFVL